jgi:hypothetical protein
LFDDHLIAQADDDDDFEDLGINLADGLRRPPPTSAACRGARLTHANKANKLLRLLTSMATPSCPSARAAL